MSGSESTVSGSASRRRARRSWPGTELGAETAARAAEPRQAERNRYADLLRVAAISLVVIGHWLLTAITDRHGQLTGADAMTFISWSGWATLFFQVMPVFFVVGGYANATSWTAHHDRGEDWAGWVRDRAMRLLWPTTVYVLVAVAAVALSRIAGVSPATLAQAGWLVALQLWFLPVYLGLIALTPVMLAAHRRWGFAVPVAMTLAAAGVDTGVVGPHLPVIGFANYLLVWGSMHQWGFAWQDGSLTHPRWRPYALAAGGAAVMAGLLAWSPFPVNMIGTGNTVPPSIALLAFAAAQTGLILAAEPVMSRALARRRLWRPVKRLNSTVMTVYLWHMMPVIIVTAALYPAGVAPQPRFGSALWWELRPAWLALLAVVLVLLVAVVTWLERPMTRLPMGAGPVGPWSPVVLLLGMALAIPALARLAISGFAPGGSLPLLVLAAYVCCLVLTLLSGRPEPGANLRPVQSD
jgi:fucose 4-O-acetylase-like acetyltransferase